MTAPPATRPGRHRDRTAVIGSGISWSARWGLRLLLIAATLWLFGWVIGRFWVVVMPVVLGLIISSVLWPFTAFLRRHRWPPALASAVVLLGGLAVVAGVLVLIIPTVISQVPEIASKASDGLTAVQTWLTGPPLNLSAEQISSAVDAITTWLRNSATTIASGVLSGVSTASGVLITIVTAVLLVFFFLKDGPKFLPWLHRVAGGRAGTHLSEVLQRSWKVLGAFIRGQAQVSLIDGVFIGLGLWALGVPLAFPLAVITFFGGFIPIVGAFLAGFIAVLVALVVNGWVNALLALALIVLVQQVEGNVLQPILQSKQLNLHAAVVLLAVIAGSSLYGITGAFLSVPVVAVLVEIWRYLNQQILAVTGEGSSSPSGDGED